MSPVSGEQLQAAKSDNIPGGVLQRNNWFIAFYVKWSGQRKVSSKENFSSPSKELLTVFTECINYWLAKFIFELRKNDGTRCLKIVLFQFPKRKNLQMGHMASEKGVPSYKCATDITITLA